MLSKKIASELKNLPTPFYLYDMDLLRETLRRVAAESSRYGYKVHYAIKANFDDRVLAAVRDAGMGIDCVSGNEVRKAIESGFPAAGIVYAGVGKSDDEIRFAIEQRIFAFNCESSEELEVIDSLAAKMGVVMDVALRINPDVDPMTHRYISTGQADSKFGIAYSEIESIVDRLPELKNINITGLHFHIGSQIRELRVFEYLCRRVNTLAGYFRERGLQLTHLNMGGGLGVEYKRPDTEPIPDFAGYFAIFNEFLQPGRGVEVHFELGRSIVAQCGEVISRVLFNKVTAGGRNVAIIDASMTELIRPALYQAHHAIENLDARKGGMTKVYTVAGTVCESSDTFAHDLTLPELRRGDMVSIKTAGAYGAAMASRYNLHDLPRTYYHEGRVTTAGK